VWFCIISKIYGSEYLGNEYKTFTFKASILSILKRNTSKF
jgi:hypothetical protein